ncbi:MAG TPA: cob(I)yrinic acid a,c-diamide adenosyltransferase [Candidatus Saccharimonadales bacterium]|nr:cob(I)yrinic acid a,c-diamide adenosyltransferase [Candidatus Saccharimonadales bacterium]
MSIRITRVYTRAGDAGETQLVGGQRVPKDSLRIQAYGTVDELNAVLGLARTANREAPGPEEARAEVETALKRIQNELFNLGSDLATRAADRHPQQPRIEPRHVKRLEEDLDRLNAGLPMLKSFVLPGGGWVSAFLHQARTVCRRAERLVVQLAREEEISEPDLPYLNRLSDYLFVLGRWAARQRGEDEPLWEAETT